MSQAFSIATPAAPRTEPLQERKVFDARALTGPGGLAEIMLDDKIYTLRITRAGKLILTK